MPPPVVVIVTEIPTPYRAPLYDRLAARGVIVPHVLYLVEREVSRTTLSVDCSGHRHEHLRGGGLSLRTYNGPFTWKWTRGLRRRLGELSPDAVLVSGWAQAAMHVASRTAAATGIPSLVTSESHPRVHRLALRGWLRDRVARPLVARASAWLPVSARAQALLERLGAEASRCFVVPNAPDVARFAAARADEARRRAVRTELGVGDEALVLFVGRLIPAKGLDVLLDALAERTPASRTVIAGGGPQAARLAAKIRALGLDGRVRLLGEQPYARVVELCAAADVIVLPSVHEPYGVALHEGMAAGCAAIASEAVGAARDLIEDGVSGHVVATANSTALADALADLLRDRERLAQMGRAAALRAVARGQLFAAEQMERAVSAALDSRTGTVGPRRAESAAVTLDERTR